MGLTIETLTREALRLVDRDGLDKLSMRTLAAELDVSAMALYRHVANKDELLDHLVAAVFATVTVPPPDLAWDQRLRRLAHDTRRVVAAHPHLARLLFDRPTRDGAVVDIVDHLYGALLEAGLPPAQVPRYERLLSSLVLGFAVSEAGGRFGPHDQRRQTRATHSDPTARPHHAQLHAVLAEAVDWDQEFDADITDLIAMIRTHSSDTSRRIIEPAQ